MSLQIVSLTRSKSKSGYAFSIRVDDKPLLLLDAGCGSDGSVAWKEQAEQHPHIWISHGHADHIGALPHLLGEWNLPQLFLPRATVPFANGVLRSIGYTQDRLDAIFRHATQIEAGEKFAIGPFAAQIAPSGHGFGAHILHLTYEDVKIAYTGDWALHPRFGTPPAQLSLLENVDFLIAEASFSGAKHLDHYEPFAERKRFQSFLGLCDHDNSHVPSPRLIIVAPFSELEEIARLVEYTAEQLREPVSFAEGIGPLVNLPDVPLATAAAQLADNQIVVACGSSLSLDQPSGALALPLVENPKARIALINRVPPNSPAQHLLQTPRRSRGHLFNKKRRLRAHVEHFIFPDHALPNDLIDIFSKPHFKQILLFHAKEESLYHLKNKIDGSRYAGRIKVNTSIQINRIVTEESTLTQQRTGT